MNGPIQVIRKRRDSDCGVACFAMLFGISYEEAAEALAITNGPLGRGLYNSSLKKAAEVVGRPLRAKRKFNPEDTVGIVSLDRSDLKIRHYVLLVDGMVIDPDDATLWSYDDYLKTYKFNAVSVLVFKTRKE